MRAALIETATGSVKNVIELPDGYDPEDEGAYLPPSGYEIVMDPTGEAVVGGHYDEGIWDLPEGDTVPVPPSTQEQVDSLLELLVTKTTITQEEADNVKGL